MGNSEELKTQFSKILRSNGIKDSISEVVIKDCPDLKGAHLASLIEYATISFIDSSKPNLEFFIKKTIPSTGSIQLDTNFKTVTKKEGLILTNFVKEMTEFCNDRLGTDDLIRDLFPRVYYCDEKSIIMDNLMKQNYKMLPKQERQDMETIKLVLKKLAAFHAVSYCLIVSAGGQAAFEETHPYIEDIWLRPESSDLMSKMLDSNIALMCGVLEKSGSTDKEAQKVCQLLKKRQGCCLAEILDCVKAEEKFPVVNHGDFWNNNMMFRTGPEYGDGQVAFVDLQISRVGSPNLDLGYYIFTTVKPELRKQWRSILEYYFNEFKANISSLSIAFPFQFEDFVQDFKIKAKRGFFFGLILVIGFEAMNNHDTAESHKEDGEEFIDVFNKMMSDWVEQNPEKCTRLCEDFKTMVNDYLLFGEL